MAWSSSASIGTTRTRSGLSRTCSGQTGRAAVSASTSSSSTTKKSRLLPFRAVGERKLVANRGDPAIGVIGAGLSQLCHTLQCCANSLRGEVDQRILQGVRNEQWHHNRAALLERAR